MFKRWKYSQYYNILKLLKIIIMLAVQKSRETIKKRIKKISPSFQSFVVENSDAE